MKQHDKDACGSNGCKEMNPMDSQPGFYWNDHHCYLIKFRWEDWVCMGLPRVTWYLLISIMCGKFTKWAGVDKMIWCLTIMQTDWVHLSFDSMDFDNWNMKLNVEVGVKWNNLEEKSLPDSGGVDWILNLLGQRWYIWRTCVYITPCGGRGLYCCLGRITPLFPASKS